MQRQQREQREREAVQRAGDRDGAPPRMGIGLDSGRSVIRRL
ncbi:DUF6191 domain-containing protein [Streptomyces sp. NPDC059802]